jgi:hypothetical protein
MVESPNVDVIGFLDWFYKTYGPNWTLVLIFSIPIAIFGWQVFQALRKDREANLAISAKEETIQRLADENRLYRILIAQEKWGWSEQQIEKYILKNEPQKESDKKDLKKK